MSTKVTSAVIVSSSLDSSPVGASSPSTGAFTAITGSSLSVTGAVNATTVGVVGNITCGGITSSTAVNSATLNVSGAASLGSLAVSGATALNGGGTSVTPSPGDNSTKIATTAWFQATFGASLTANGYYKLPGGLIVQWGQTPNFGVGSGTVTFPTAFPNTCFVVVATDHYAGNSRICSTSGLSATQFTLTTDGDNSGNWWIALGY